MLSNAKALAASCDQVLWLDAAKHRNIEELSGMNIFFVEESGKYKKIITPDLGSTILPGITRDSILTIAQKLGYKVKEARLPIKEILKKISSREISESFATGTMIGVQAISSFNYQEAKYQLPNLKSSVAMTLKSHLNQIKYGSVPDKNNFMYILDPKK